MVLLDADQRTHAGEKLSLIERLHHEVVRSGLEGFQLLLAAARRDHHHRKKLRRRGRADAATYLVPIDLGHHDVEQDQIGKRFRVEPLERIDSRVDGIDRVSAWAQDGVEQADVLRGVVHDQDAGFSCGHALAVGAMWARRYEGSSRTLIGFSR